MSESWIVFAALSLDAVAGEPQWLWSRVPHPAVIMGRAVAALDRSLNHPSFQRVSGVISVALLGAGAIGIGLFLEALPFSAVWTVLLGAVLLAQRSLVEHVADVATGLRRNIGEGRAMVARIVGRDTADMDEPAVARAAIESALENLSDGVVAPAFWFLVAGLPGILLYKAVNTADSMIGHRTPRHEAFGWAAARLDDVLNWIPARLTALIIAGLSGGLRHWPAIVAEARRHRSPNAGWPEAAGARALGVALSGPRSYHGRIQSFPFVNPESRHRIGPSEIDATIGLLWRVWAVVLTGTALLAAVA